MADEHLQEYFQAVCEAFRLGNIETSYNAPIMALLSHFGCNARDLSGERSGEAGENPDIKLWHNDVEITETDPFSMIEMKKVGGIDARAKTQAKKGATLFGYSILTDNCVWEFWRAGEDKMYGGVRLMEIANGKLALKHENIELFISLMQDFLLQDPAQIRSSNKLAEYMAIHAKTIRSVITGILKENEDALPQVNDRQKRLPLFPELHGLFTRIKADLRPLLNTRSFADMYAQTIVYGLFIARHNDAATATFNRYEAISKLQEESALLNRFFEHITNTGTKHPMLDAIIDKLCALYQQCDISTLLENDKRGDAVIHFYEDFLSYYDPELRKSLGVFYTPYQVVQYLISMVDKLLVDEFGIVGGLSNNDQIEITVPSERHEYQARKGAKREWRDTKKILVPRVAILDPACGTGTFHAEIIKYIKDTYFSGVRAAFYDDYMHSENSLLTRMIGFEIMMTSYAVAHLKVRRAISETLGKPASSQLQANIFLTNTLAPPFSDVERLEQMSLFDFSAAITDEAYNADTWKSRRPIKVIVGNPPYLSGSPTPFDLSAYRTETDGKTRLAERKQLLNDDYVKFFRFAEKIINKDGEGILTFVSNNGYLDNHGFRGMRASLLRTFDEIYIVDLHGSAIKKESSPCGGRDENIFDIMQGVSLFIGVKKTNSTEWAKVHHADLWGTRKFKFQNLHSIQFNEIVPDSKMAYFVPISSEGKTSYDSGISLKELFPASVSGIQSGNDKVAYAPTKQELLRRLDIVRHSVTDKDVQDVFGSFARGQSAESVRDDTLLQSGTIVQAEYRPFHKAWTYYTGVSCGYLHFPRDEKISRPLISSHTSPIGKNIGLLFSRGVPTSSDFAHIFVTDTLVDLNHLQIRGGTVVAPLYLFIDINEEWHPNFAPEVLQRLTKHMSVSPQPIEIFDYIYGVLHDPVYRERFNEYLKRDFPRVPIIGAPKENDDDFVVSEEMFRSYVTAGERLRKLHLMQTKAPASIEIDPPTSTDLEIGAIKYKDGILHLNPNKRITGIPSEVWGYRIGGYHVLDKWFKSHKGKTMSVDDFEHIANVVGLLAETIKIQTELGRLSHHKP